MYITFLQISQMIAGVAITVCGFIYSRDPECAVVPNVGRVCLCTHAPLWVGGLVCSVRPSGRVCVYARLSASPRQPTNLRPSLRFGPSDAPMRTQSNL